MENLTLKQKISKVQSEIGALSKNQTNPFLSSKYFDINQLMKQLQPLIEKYNLIILQPITDNIVTTKIYDIDSDASVSSSLVLPDIKDPQKIGSAITYFRRYTLASLLALQAVDDDANLASKKEKPSKIELNPSSENWSKIVNVLKEGKYNIEDIETKYTISKDDKVKLLKESLNV